MSIVGYARVSTQEQDLSAQLAALRAAGAGSIFKEKISGVRADRPQLTKMVAALRRGDLVVVTRLDRLGRSVRELLNLLADFEKTGVHFKSLGDPWCDTTTAHGRLMLTVLGGLAEFERSLAPLREAECVVLRKGALWRSEPGARLSRPLHPPGGSFQRAAALWERRTGHVSVERLPHEGQTEVEGHDPRKR